MDAELGAFRGRVLKGKVGVPRNRVETLIRLDWKSNKIPMFDGTFFRLR